MSCCRAHATFWSIHSKKTSGESTYQFPSKANRMLLNPISFARWKSVSEWCWDFKELSPVLIPVVEVREVHRFQPRGLALEDEAATGSGDELRSRILR